MKSNYPVAIGGIGGSGTRVIALALESLGYFMGHDLNHAHDNLSFTLLFKHREMLDCSEAEFSSMLDIFIRAMSGSLQQWTDLDLMRIRKAALQANAIKDVVDWYKTRADILHNLDSCTVKKMKWGWKEPNTHIFLEQLFRQLPQLKYIHVRRNGLDMAYSSNQRQLKLWGESLLKFVPSDLPDPAQALAFWCAAEKRFIEIVARLQIHANVHVVDFDMLCTRPDVEFLALIRFLRCIENEQKIDQLVKLVSRPDTSNRREVHRSPRISASDLEFVRSLGYE